MGKEKGPNEIYCRSCGEPIKKKAEMCPECGVPNEYSKQQGRKNNIQQETYRRSTNGTPSQRQQYTQGVEQSLTNAIDSLLSPEQSEHNPSEYQTSVTGNWHYGVGASVILWITALFLSEIVSSISAIALLTAWVLMPISIYYDREILRATTNWNPNLIGWIILSIVPLINIVAGAIYLFRRYNTQKVSRPSRGVSHSREEDDALQQLRERYTKGELTDAEFEEKVEQLVSTESKETAEMHIQSKDKNEQK